MKESSAKVIEEVRITNFKRSGFYVQLISSPFLKIREDEDQSYYIIIVDISTHKETQDLLRTFLDSAPEGLLVVDDEFKIKMVNAAILRYFKYKELDIIGLPFDSLVVPTQRESLTSAVDILRNQDQQKNSIGKRKDLKGVTFDNLEFFINIHLEAFDYQKKKFILATIRDTTEEKKWEEQLTRAKEFADAASLAKSFFIKNISHEIRTPLTAIIGYTELLLKKTELEEDVSEKLFAVARNSNYLLSLINEVLDLSKIEAGKIKVDITSVSILNLLYDVLCIGKELIRDKNLYFKIKVEGEVPEKILADFIHLKQTLINLVGNASKFTDTGGITLTVKSKLESKEGSPSSKHTIQFYVEDTGRGIDRLDQENIFMPFEQATLDTKNSEEGTGLGLAISKKLTNLMGGDLSLIESTPNIGSTFLVELNVEGEDNSRFISQFDIDGIEKYYAPPPQENATTDEKVINLNGLRILVTDDTKDNQIIISAFLKNAGAIVDIAQDGIEAISAAAKREYDAILVDIRMPILSGHETATRLRQSGYTGPLIAISAGAWEDEINNSLWAGFDDHISKPIDSNLLLANLSSWLRTYKHITNANH